MKLSSKNQLTFGKIADEWAKEPGALSRDEIFHELLRALWEGAFEDEDGGNTCLAIHGHPPGGAARADGKYVDEHHQRTDESRATPFNRRVLLKMLAADCPPGVTLPKLSPFDDAGTGGPPVPWPEVKAEVLWAALIALTLSEYPRIFREAYLEPLTISKVDFRPVARRRQWDLPRFWYGDVAADEVALKATPDRDDEIGMRIQRVLVAGEELRAKNSYLSTSEIANWLAKRDGTGKFEQYGDVSIRKILSGRFDPANRRGIPGLNT